MTNFTANEFISHISKFLPDRKTGKRGPKPIPKKTLLQELFIKFKRNLPWYELKHSSTCRAYLKEIQRRGLLKKFFNSLKKNYTKYRLQKTIIDSSDIGSYRTNHMVKYSGKYHKNCIKLTVEVTDKLQIVDFRLDKGSRSDSKILDDMLDSKEKLPYELFMDKGYEKYERRRELKNKNCQVRMEPKKKAKKHIRGRRFMFTGEHKRVRQSIEKIFGWLKSFESLRLNKLRLISNIRGMLLIVLSYFTFNRL